MSDADREGRVSRRAYELWEQEGGEHGRHDDHWHRAAAEHDEEIAIPAPDGTTLTVPVDEIEGDAGGDAPKPARKRAAPRAKAEPAATPTPAKAPDKAAPKPRKPKAK